MANTFGPNTWKIDTAATLVSDKVTIRGFEFLPNAAGDDVVVKDAAGNLVWEVVNAYAAGQVGKAEKDFGSGREYLGLTVSTLSASAILYVYL